jgi:hypothetical protein
VAVTLATCIGVTARSQTNQAGGAAAANSAGTQVGAQAPGAAANAAGQTRGGVGTTPAAVSEANPVGAQSPALGANAAGQSRGGFADESGFDGFNGISRNPFFADPGVQQQLGLSQEDLALLNQAYSENWTRYNQGVLGIGNNLPAQQRLMALQRLEAQFNEGFGQTVNSTLTNPELSQRFNQLNMQFQNFGAFNDPVVREQLNLTPQQQRQIRRMSNEWRQQLRRLRRAGNDIDPQMADQQFNVMQEQYQAQLGQVLTPEQQQTWTGLIGERYSFPRTSYVPPNEDMRNENQQRRVIPHGGIDNGTAQDQTIRRNVTPHNDGTAGTTQQNQGVRRNVTPHGGSQSAQRQSGNSVR